MSMLYSLVIAELPPKKDGQEFLKVIVWAEHDPCPGQGEDPTNSEQFVCMEWPVLKTMAFPVTR